MHWSMTALTHLLPFAMEMFMMPFGEDTKLPPLVAALKIYPGACVPTKFRWGENELVLSVAPKGHCPNCCPVNSEVDVKFILYTRAKRNGIMVGPAIRKGNARRAGVDPGFPTEIFIHGFTEPSPGQSGKAIVDAYLSRPENYNVILVDWSNLSPFPWYPNAVRNVKIVSDALRKFLETYNDSGEIPIKNVHIIGFSLGSHIAGFAGKRLKRSMKIPRITALDPALPNYSLSDASRRLTKSDAEYIDVIHTDAGVFGLPISVGHADFYPNGGKALQPGCQPSYLVQVRLIEAIFACSHVRAWRLYAESVRNPKGFPATRCSTWRGNNKTCDFTMDAHMGFSSAKKTQGQFYLMTGYKGPFAKTVVQQMSHHLP